MINSLNRSNIIINNNTEKECTVETNRSDSDIRSVYI